MAQSSHYRKQPTFKNDISPKECKEIEKLKVEMIEIQKKVENYNQRVQSTSTGIK